METMPPESRVVRSVGDEHHSFCDQGVLVTQDERRERRVSAKKAQPRGRPKARLCDLNEVAAYLHVSRTTMYRLLDRGLPALRVGYVLRFDLAVVLEWIQQFTDRGDQLHWTDEYPSIKRRNRRVN